MGATYRGAGVDIDEGDRLVELIKPQFSPDGSQLAFLADPNGNGTSTLELSAVAGSAPVLLNVWTSQFAFAGKSLVALRTGTPPPFGFQDGVYVTALP